MSKSKLIDSRDKARRLIKASLAKKPGEPLVLDVRVDNSTWDYFIFLTSTSSPHARAIVDELTRISKEEGIAIHHVESDEEWAWVLIDYFDVIVHIFSQEKRQFYRLERLFKNAKKVRFRFKTSESLKNKIS